MQVSVEKVSNVERRLTIIVPANQVEEAYTKQLDRFAKNANIKGFRQGKAPISHIKQRFGDDARKEALSEVIQKALYDAIVEQNLKPINTPRVETKTILADQPLEFTASFEVLPEIESVSLQIDQIEKPIVEITDADTQRVLSQLQKQYTQWKLVDRAIQEKDRVVIDYYAIFEDKSEKENSVKNYPLEIGSKTMLPGFESGLIGHKAGDECTLTLTFPEDFHIAERAGKPIEFVVTIKQVFEAIMPEWDDTFIKKLGIHSGERKDLETQIKQSLEQERDRLIIEKLKEQVFNKLLDQNKIDVPHTLIQREAHNIHDEIYKNQQHDHHSHSDEEMTAFNEIAKKRVILGLLIASYAKQMQITADKERVDKRIQEIASAYEHPQEVIAWLSSAEQRGGLEAQVMEDQILDKLMSGIPVVEKNVTYAELKGIEV